MTVAVVLDVNVVVSAVMSPLGAPRLALEVWRSGKAEVITSDGIIAEVAAKLRDPTIGGRFNVTLADVQAVTLLLRTAARHVQPPTVAAVTGDPEDDHVLAAVEYSHADYLVTGDKGLLRLGQHGGAQIISPRTFVELIDSPS